VGRCTSVGVEEEERGAGNSGAGAVDDCSGVGRCTGLGVKEERGAGNGGAGARGT